MPARTVSGTEGYAAAADVLIAQYESLSFADVHGGIMHLLPSTPCDVIDIGAGSGRDAAALAGMGHRVVAVEPTAELRRRAIEIHRSWPIRWIDDSLPELATLQARCNRFDIVMLSAVWMHLGEDQRRVAMPRISALLRQNGIMMMSLRHGPVPAGRRMFEVSADETMALARAEGLRCVLNVRGTSAQVQPPDVAWTRLAFRRDGLP